MAVTETKPQSASNSPGVLGSFSNFLSRASGRIAGACERDWGIETRYRTGVIDALAVGLKWPSSVHDSEVHLGSRFLAWATKHRIPISTTRRIFRRFYR